MTELEQLLAYLELYKDLDGEKVAELLKFSDQISILEFNALISMIKVVHACKSKIVKSNASMNLFMLLKRFERAIDQNGANFDIKLVYDIISSAVILNNELDEPFSKPI